MSVRDFQEKKRILRALYSMPVLIILIILAIVSAWGTLQTYQSLRVSQAQVDKVQKDIDQTIERRKEYESRMSALQTPQGLDEEARGRYNLKKSGEEIVFFIDPSEKETSQNVEKIWYLKSLVNLVANIFR